MDKPYEVVRRGTQASAEEGAAWLARLEDSSHDLEARLFAIGVLRGAQRLPHLTWLVENHPTLELFMYWRAPSALEADLSRLWAKALSQNQWSLQVAINASWSVCTQVDFISDIFEKGIASAAPGDRASWWTNAADFYEHRAYTLAPAARGAKALRCLFECFVSLATREEQFLLLFRLRHCARLAGAEQEYSLLELAHQEERGVRGGPNERLEHVEATVCGLVALAHGSDVLALKWLDRAKAVWHPPAPPCTSLADQLSRRGYAKEAQAYFQACKWT